MSTVKINMTDFMATVTHGLPRVVDISRFQAELGAKAMAHWKKLAQEKLRSSSRDYAQALSMREEGQRTYIELVGMVPNMIENGWRGGDLRDWLLKGPNAKMGKNGMYNTVPFRHGTPGTGGRNVGTPMPNPIYKAAKGLQVTRSKPTILQKQGGWIDVRSTKGKGTVLYGQRLEPTMRGVSRQVKNMLQTKKKDWHTTSTWTGMIREEKTYENATQHRYTTFRRISRVKKHPQSWMHPGIKPRHFAREVQKELERVGPYLFQQILEAGG